VLAELEDAARRGLVPESPVHALERGEISIEEFERRLAEALGERGSSVDPQGLLGRVLGGLAELRDDMLGLVRRARHSGLRTALLSNSWGESNYPETQWEGAFDVVVISGRVGMRKPEAQIFHHTADLLGVDPAECVMVDDLAGNIRGAVAAGMVGVLHKSYEETAEELEILFDRKLR
jgi:epoxide hydrolase-like predicted phosphatase